MQTDSLAKKSHKKCFILLHTDQIKLNIYPDLLKENPLIRKFLSSESKAYFLDEIFYHTHIPLFSMTVPGGIVIKAANIACTKSSITHMT